MNRKGLGKLKQALFIKRTGKKGKFFCTVITIVHHEKSLIPVFFKGLCLSPLFDKLESGKRNNTFCFGKSLEKVLNFGSKTL